MISATRISSSAKEGSNNHRLQIERSLQPRTRTHPLPHPSYASQNHLYSSGSPFLGNARRTAALLDSSAGALTHGLRRSGHDPRRTGSQANPSAPRQTRSRLHRPHRRSSDARSGREGHCGRIPSCDGRNVHPANGTASITRSCSLVLNLSNHSCRRVCSAQPVQRITRQRAPFRASYATYPQARSTRRQGERKIRTVAGRSRRHVFRMARDRRKNHQ